LQDTYHNAPTILAKVPVEHEIIPEEAAEGFANRFGKLIQDHERQPV
jgi:hypothetical protein